MQFHYLDEFLRLESYPSLSKAAQGMGISQPLLSRHVQAIEKELGVTLLDRSRQQIEFTAAGKILLARLQEMLPYWEQSKQLAVAASSQKSQLTLGGSLGSAYLRGLIFAAVEISRMKFEPLDITLNYEARLSDLRNGGIDAMACYQLPQEDIQNNGLVEHFLGKDGVSAILYKTHPLAHRESLKLEELRGECLVKLTGDYFNYGLWWRSVKMKCEEAGFNPQVHSVYVKNPDATPQFYIGNDVFLCATQNARTGFWHANPLYKTVPISNVDVGLFVYHTGQTESRGLSQFMQIVGSDELWSGDEGEID